MTSLQTNTTLAKNRMQNSLGSAVFLAFFLLFVPLLLVGCGGGGGTVTTAPTTPTTKVTLSGTAFDAAIVGGTVTVLDSNGSVLGTTTTDANGQFSLDVPEDKLAGGYRFSVSGGTMDGAAFTGTLTATYAAKDAKNTVNLTPITTLLDRLAEGQAGGTFLEKRDAAIQQLIGLGMVKADDWFALASDRFDLNILAARIGAKGGLQAWLDALVADLADGELSIEEMAAFPKTNGGITSVGLQGATAGVFSVFIGDALQAKINVAGQDGASYQYQAVTAPNGLTVSADGAIAYTLPEGTSENQNIPLVFKVTNVATGLGRTVSANIYPMKRNVSGGETVSPGTGVQTVTTTEGDTSVKISTDNMTAAGKVEIVQSLNAEGNPQTTYNFDKNIKGTVEITLPDPNAPPSDTFSAPVGQEQVMAAPQAKAQPQVRAIPQAKAPSAYEELLKYVWMSRKANFLKTSCGGGVGNRVSDAIVSVDMDRCTVYPRQVTIDAVREDSFTLTSECLVGDRACLSGKTPVLFVHGFLPSTKLGGGEGTWKYFPQAIKNRISDARVFEFQWRTSARFEDAAGDLALAVKLIAEETGQKVHIIAHSFGGVLTRTYLQGLATGMPYNNDVASVTTVGSPHSGIFDTAKKAHGVSFPQGQDKNYGANLSGNQNINFCQQTSCYQMGESVDFSKVERLLFGVEVTGLSPGDMPGKFIAGLSDMQTHPLPAGLPIQVLIGLTTSMYDNHVVDTGDGLISFEGQRISPTLDISQAYRNQTTQFGGIVTEKLLGLEPSLYPGDKYLGTGTGYRHSDLIIFPSDAIPEVQVSEVCDGNPDCANEHQHLAFLNAKNWIIAAGKQAYTGSTGKFTIEPFMDIPTTGAVAIAALHPTKSLALSQDNYNYLKSIVDKANNSKIVQGGVVHWERLGKTESEAIKAELVKRFGKNAASIRILAEMNEWSIKYQTKIPQQFEETYHFPWATAEGWKVTFEALLNSLKAGVGAAKIGYAATPIAQTDPLTKLDNLLKLKGQLAKVESAAKALDCGDYVIALSKVEGNDDKLDAWKDVLIKGGSCITGMVGSERWEALFKSADVAKSLEDAKYIVAVVDFTNLLVGSVEPPTPATTALSGFLDITSAAMNNYLLAQKYNNDTLKQMLVDQSRVSAEIDRVLNGQFAWYVSRVINATLGDLLVVQYAVADFTITPDTPTVGIEVKFAATASSTKGAITSYAWDFGDGVTDNPIGLPKATTYHTYTKPGTYTVKLTVMDGVLPVTVTKTITIGEALDEDTDGMPDWWETKYGVTDANADDDGDGLKNLDEYKAGTIPKGEGAQDTDSDGFKDGEEVDRGTSPTDPKTWPLQLTARADDEQVTLIWNHAPEGTPAVAYYSACYALTDIYPRTVTDNVVTDQASCQQKEGGVWIPSINEATYQVSNLDMAKTYHFMVLGMDSDGKEVRRSNEAIARPLNPATPKNVTATAVLQKKVRLTWSAVEGSTGYAYCYSFLPDDCLVYKETSLWMPTQEVSVLIEDLRNVPHYFRVVSFDKDGKVSPVSKEATATPTAITASAGIKAIAAGSFHSLALKQDGNLITWGLVGDGDDPPLAESLTIPVGLNGVMAIAAGGSHSLALKQNGTVVAWGWQGNAPATVPTDLRSVTAISASCGSSMALRQDGTVVAWEWSGSGYEYHPVPAHLSNVKAISAGCHHYLALKQDGTVAAWGYAWDGQRAEDVVPADLTGVVAVAAGSYGHSLALKQDGTVVAWGGNPSVQGNVPAGLTGVVAIAAGGDGSSLAVKQNGTVVTWGTDIHIDPSPVAAHLSGVVAVAADGGDPFTQAHFLALKQDGTVVAWGGNGNGQATVPAEIADPSFNFFTVQATDEVGTAFTVPAGKTQCTFNATGTWKWDAPSPAVTPDGGGPAHSGFRVPTGNAFDLIVQRGDGSFGHIGSSHALNVTSNEVLHFMMNDVPGAYGDNSGALSVSWSCQ